MATSDTSQVPFVVISTTGLSKYAVVDTYQTGRSIKLGKALLAMASVCMCSAVSGTAVQTQRYYWNRYYVIASGMWCPIFYFLAGGFGLGTAGRNSVCMVRTNLAMSILSAMAGLTDATMAFFYVEDEIYEYLTDNENRKATTALLALSGFCSLAVVGLSIPLGHLSSPLVCKGMLIIPFRVTNVARTNQSTPREEHQNTPTQARGTPGNAAPGVDNMLMQVTSMSAPAVTNAYSPQHAIHVSSISRVSGQSEYEEVDW